MTTALHSFLLAGALYLDPAQTRDYEEITAAIANVVAREKPLFAGDESRFRTASLVEAVAWREGGLRVKVLGDCDGSKPGAACKGKAHAFCTMQIHDSSGGTEALNDDPEACIKAGLEMLRASIRTCRSHPVAWYASGPLGCTNERAQRISRDRVGLALRIYAAATTAVSEES